jgi:hypothetical protein
MTLSRASQPHSFLPGRESPGWPSGINNFDANTDSAVRDAVSYDYAALFCSTLRFLFKTEPITLQSNGRIFPIAVWRGAMSMVAKQTGRVRIGQGISILIASLIFSM